MINLRKQNKITDQYSKTQPDDTQSSSLHRLNSLDPQQSLFQISLKANEQDFAVNFTAWRKQIVKTQSINLLSPTNLQQGCLNMTLSNLKTSNVVLKNKEFQLKKWREMKHRQSELKKSIMLNQKKKSFVPINFNLQNYDNKKYSSRIHSRTFSTSFYSSTYVQDENPRLKSQICCDLEQPQRNKSKKVGQESFISLRDNKRVQNQLIIHKKKIKTSRETSDIDQQQTSFRQPSFSKYFNIINNLVQEQKKKLFFPLKRLCPTAKLKGIFQKRRHSVNK